MRLTALVTPRWMSWKVVAGKPILNLLHRTSLERNGGQKCFHERWIALKHTVGAAGGGGYRDDGLDLLSKEKR